MEHIDQERDQNIPRHDHESPMKLPLAPLVLSNPPRSTTVSTRRGISIFSPKQTLDQLLYEANPTQDPDPTTAKAGGASSSRTQSQPPPETWVPRQSPEPEAPVTFNRAASITYRECLKNHAARTGGHAVDGCREFMPSREDGTQESLNCAACNCHRNFHRKEIGGEQESFHFLALPTIAAAPPLRQLQFATTVTPMPPTMVDFAGNGGRGVAESSSEYLDMFQSSSGGHASMLVSSSGSKKRSRTKFNQKQKNRMHEFATKLGWRIQNEDDEEVLKFCDEVGVKRQVFKVWMHNNKKRPS